MHNQCFNMHILSQTSSTDSSPTPTPSDSCPRSLQWQLASESPSPVCEEASGIISPLRLGFWLLLQDRPLPLPSFTDILLHGIFELSTDFLEGKKSISAWPCSERLAITLNDELPVPAHQCPMRATNHQDYRPRKLVGLSHVTEDSRTVSKVLRFGQ